MGYRLNFQKIIIVDEILMIRRSIYFFWALFFSLSAAQAGQIIVQKSSDPNKIDVFELKKELLEQQRWQEQLRAEAHLQWLRELPIGCVVGENGDYQCGLVWYRPYRYRQQQLFIEVPRPHSREEKQQ